MHIKQGVLERPRLFDLNFQIVGTELSVTPDCQGQGLSGKALLPLRPRFRGYIFMDESVFHASDICKSASSLISSLPHG